MSDTLTTIQDAIRDRLAAVPYFATAPAIPVLSESHGDLANEMAIQLDQLGIGAVVKTTSLQPSADLPDRALQMSLAISIGELVVLNRSATGSQKPAMSAALEAWNSLNGWTPLTNWTPVACRRITSSVIEGLLVYVLEADSTLLLS
ncbi:MAG: hypothetical protein VW338_03470 [Rhodospirillaceae bacterium]